MVMQKPLTPISDETAVPLISFIPANHHTMIEENDASFKQILKLVDIDLTKEALTHEFNKPEMKEPFKVPKGAVTAFQKLGKLLSSKYMDDKKFEKAFKKIGKDLEESEEEEEMVEFPMDNSVVVGDEYIDQEALNIAQQITAGYINTYITECDDRPIDLRWITNAELRSIPIPLFNKTLLPHINHREHTEMLKQYLNVLNYDDEATKAVIIKFVENLKKKASDSFIVYQESGKISAPTEERDVNYEVQNIPCIMQICILQKNSIYFLQKVYKWNI